MAGIKRKLPSESAKPSDATKSKKLKSAPAPPAASKAPKAVKKITKSKPAPESDDIDESDTTESENGFYGFSAKEGEDENSPSSAGDESDVEDEQMEVEQEKGQVNSDRQKAINGGTSSKEAHAKQKALAKERKAAKPNADSIIRSKKIWERLRRKSHVPKDERKQLVTELYEIVTGRVKEFVFKHDSVRVIQCALKYANLEQRKMIARELKGEYRSLAESRYAKFLIGKLLVEGDAEVRDLIIPEFHGHVRRLINHPEASWILDDIYRGIATPQQKAILLREWYGPEFAIFKTANKEDATADLSMTLEETPEKRKPIMSYLFGLINQLIQKKLTGFTMLHDAMLQYFLNIKPGSEEATEFLELLKGDEEGDLLKNLAFTKSGSRVVCLALAYGSAKDRKNILKVYKDTIETLGYDNNGHKVLLAAFDVIDDTVLTSRSIFPELLGKDAAAQPEKIVALANHLVGRIPLLYPITGPAKSLFTDDAELKLLDEIHEVRSTTSKKEPEIRRKELVRSLSGPVLATIAAEAAQLAQSSFGCQLITEALLGCEGDKEAAVNATADVAAGDPSAEDHIARSSHGGRMLKTLVLGGHYDPKTKKVTLVDPPLNFHDALYERIKEHVLDWATGSSSFVVVNLLEAEGFSHREELVKTLKKNRKRLETAAKEETEEQKARRESEVGGDQPEGEKKNKGRKKKAVAPAVGNAGAKLLLQKLA
ncbi:Pumilio y domain member 6 [Coniosporium apollinis]|uniref:Pumilio y domain member 6 n=1 Tax=Coniosporium apollinis TaxID=61459 RepID=A0ABQ9NPV1_9PEZI|nr:Pumilio y domain member 6 [Coniosporium apollinis]